MTQSTVRTPSRRDSRIPQVAKLSLSYVVLITDGCVRRTGSVDVSDHVQDQRRSYTVGSDLVSSRFLDGGLPDDIEHDFADAGSSVAAQQRARGGAHVVLVLATAAPAAYALARLDFRGRNVMFAVIISTLLIPPIIFLMPTYLIVDYLRWIDTLLAVIVPTAAGHSGSSS